MTNFHTNETQILEPMGIAVLHELGIRVKANNKETITDPDYILKPGVYFDFQYSNNFEKYGDIRIDTVSSYENSAGNRIKLQNEIRNFSENTTKNTLASYLESFLKIEKHGKYFEPNQIVAILYFIYNYKFNLKNPQAPPDQILLIAVSSIKHYINENWKNLISNGMLKLNDKSLLGDRHGSAFICLNLKQLIETFCELSMVNFNFFSTSIPTHIDKKLRYLINVKNTIKPTL